MMNYPENTQLTNFDKFVFWFVIIDNLFLPYFFIKCVSYSMPVVFIWILFSNRRLNTYRHRQKLINIFCLLAGISTLLGCFLYSKYAVDDIVKLLTFLFSFACLYLFEFVRENSNEELKNKVNDVLFFFLIFVFIFCLIYFASTSLYNIFRHFFNMRIELSSNDIYTNTIRFGYYWSDENNIGYVVVGVMLFLCFNSRFSVFKKLIMIVMTSIIVIATMSTGALIALALGLVCIFLFGLRLSSLSRYVSRTTFLALIFSTVLIVLAIHYRYLLFDSSTYKAFILRLEGKQINGDSRSSIYSTVLSEVNWWKYLFIGYGGRTIINGVYRSVHNGIFHMIMSCGLPGCIIYNVILWWKEKGVTIREWLWRIPIALGFLINIMITEDKLDIVIMLLLAFEGCRYVNEKNNDWSSQNA